MFIIGAGGSGDDDESVPLLVYVVAVDIDNDNGRPGIVWWCCRLIKEIDSYPLSRGGFASKNKQIQLKLIDKAML